MKDMCKMVIVLSLLCGLSGFALSYLKDVTTDKIESQVLTYVQGPALQSVFNGQDNSPIADRKVFSIDNKKITIFPARKNGKIFGIAIEEKGKGYGGDIGVMVGFDIISETLCGIGITTLKETPGLGMRVTEKGFMKQFFNKTTPVELTAQGGNIDAISGATISSSAVILAINKAANTFLKIKPEIDKIFGN